MPTKTLFSRFFLILLHPKRLIASFLIFLHVFQTLGNHGFDDGPANTARFLRNVNFSVVMSNVDAKNEPLWSGKKPLFTKSKVLEIGGEKIGIVGYVLQSTPR